MPGKDCYFLHARVFSYVYLILWVSMCGDKFINVFVEQEVANLGSSIDLVDLLSCQGIPKSYISVSRSSSWSQQTMLMRGPRNGFNSCSMFLELNQVFLRMEIPNKKLVVISTRSQLLKIWRPLQSTDFLFMCLKNENHKRRNYLSFQQ
jgi:hypothetical protein